MSRWQRFMDWLVAIPAPDPLAKQVAAQEGESAADNPFTNLQGHLTQHPPNPHTWVVARPDRPTAEELGALLEQLTTEGMPPRLQARHAARHWPGIVREEETDRDHAHRLPAGH